MKRAFDFHERKTKLTTLRHVDYIVDASLIVNNLLYYFLKIPIIPQYEFHYYNWRVINI